MWMLVKDHLRRNWFSLLLWSAIFALFLHPGSTGSNNGSHTGSPYGYLVCFFYLPLALNIPLHGNTNFIRLCRTLPLREFSFGTLAWGMSALAPPAYTYLLVLLATIPTFGFRDSSLHLVSLPLLYLLFATLCSGLITFLSTSIGVDSAHATLDSKSYKTPRIRNSKPLHTLFKLAYVGIVAVMVFHPLPGRWSEIGPLQITGMVLAAHLTWKSYQNRLGLLNPLFVQAAVTHDRRKPTSSPVYRTSTRAEVVRDVLTTAGWTGLTMLTFCVLLSLTFICLKWAELVTSAGKGQIILARCLLSSAVGMGVMFIIFQLARVSALMAIRSLPLTVNQCILLFLSYSYAVSLAVIPSLAVLLWLSGSPSLFQLLALGAVLCGGLCPFGMFILLRFGSQGLNMLIIALFLFLGVAPVTATLTQADLTLASPIALYASTGISLILGLVGLFGGRYLLMNSSDVYKSKVLPQQFGQGIGR